MARRTKSMADQVGEYQHVFHSVIGKKVLFDLMKAGHMLHTSFVPGSPEETAFREGERNMVLRILTILGTDPIRLQELIKEGLENG